MSWLIKTAHNTLEIWTDQEYALMLEKCEYYGAKPHWQEVRRLEGGTNNYVPPRETSEPGERSPIVTVAR